MHIPSGPQRIGGGNDGAVALEGKALSSCGLTDAQSHLYTHKTAENSHEPTSTLSSRTDPHLYSLNTCLAVDSPVTFGSVPSSLACYSHTANPANLGQRRPRSTLENPIALSASATLTTKSSVDSFMTQSSEETQIVTVDNQNTDKNQKAKYVENIVDTTSLVIQSIWAEQYAAKKTKLVSLRVFIQEVLRRSRTTYSTLQTALFYLFRVKNAIVTRLRERAARETEQQRNATTSGHCNEDDLIGCGRRMFLAALMVASKYLQDKNYRNRAWAKISGLSVHEINATEIAFLKLIDYNLFVSKPTFDRWYTLLHSQVAGAAACKDDQQTPSACLASDMLFSGCSADPSVERLSPLPMSLSPPAARVPSPSQTSSSSSELEETDSESLKLAKDARVRQFVQSQKLQQHAPDSGIAMYITTPKLSPESTEQAASRTFEHRPTEYRPTEHRPIARPRHLPAAPAQSSNNVVVAPYIPGVRPVVRTTSAAVAFLPSPPSVDGKRKHVELSMLDEGYSSYYESAISAIQVPDVCSVPEVKKFRADEDGYLGEDAAVVEMIY